MGLEDIFNLVYESLYAIIILVSFLAYATFKGRQAAINLILGLYLALLLSQAFPYTETIVNTAGDDPVTKSILLLVLFIFFTVASTILFTRLMPDEFLEKSYESYGKKLLISFGATILFLAFSYQVLPLGEIIDTSTPLQSLFAQPEYFFGWLLVPLIILFLL